MYSFGNRVHATARNFSKIIIYASPKKYYCILTLLFGWKVSAVGHKWNKSIILEWAIYLPPRNPTEEFSKLSTFFFIFWKGHWPFPRQSMSVNPPFLLLCFKDKETWSLYFFLFKSHISLFLAKYIFLCSWCHTQMQPSNGHQADRSFFSFLFQMDHKFELWVPLKSLLFLWG